MTGMEIGMTRGKRDKAIAIAEDVLRRLNSSGRGLKLTEGRYLAGVLDGVTLPTDGDLKDCVDTVEAHCSVCQLGALFLSRARLFDAVPMSVINERAEGFFFAYERCIRESLADVFSADQLSLMECAFECCGDFGDADADEYGRRVAASFGRVHDDPTDRCIAIMKNLIEHDGLFTPSSRGASAWA